MVQQECTPPFPSRSSAVTATISHLLHGQFQLLQVLLLALAARALAFHQTERRPQTLLGTSVAMIGGGLSTGAAHILLHQDILSSEGHAEGAESIGKHLAAMTVGLG